MEELIKAQARNPHYSMRAYSQKVGVSQSTISEILTGKRPITKKNAHKILKGLDRSPNEISFLVGNEDNDSPQIFKTLDIDVFHIIADWHYFAILNLIETKDFQNSEAWIAKRLGITEKAATDAIEKLLHLDMIAFDKKNKQLKSTGLQFEAISAVANPALKKANRQNLELANAALDSLPVSERDFSAITLCFDPDRIEEARKMIKNFRRNFNKVMESGHKKEVFKLCIQLFPLSKRGSK